MLTRTAACAGRKFRRWCRSRSTGIPIVTEYQKKIGDERNYSFTSLEGYIAAKVIVEGLRKAGRNVTRESLVDAMASLDTLDLGGFKVAYSPTNRSGSSFVELTIVSKGGKFRN